GGAVRAPGQGRAVQARTQSTGPAARGAVLARPEIDAPSGDEVSRVRRRERLRIATGLAARTTAWLIVRARLLIVAGWLAAAVLATLYLPGPQSAQSDQEVGTLIPQDAPALQTEIDSLRRFRVPLLARVAVVQRDPHGLSAAAQARIVTRALKVDEHAVSGLR